MTATNSFEPTSDELVRRSIEVIAEHQDVGGAYLASPTFPVYRYSWFRDGAFIADAMSRHGHYDSAERFFGWCARVINDRAAQIADLIERSRHGTSVGRDEHLPTRFTVDGEATGEDWWDFQLDGYGTWIFTLVAHLRRTGHDPHPDVVAAVECCVDYLCAFWSEPCYDWWEEHVDGVHVSTLVSIEAGVRAAADAGLVTGERAETARSTSAAIVDLVRTDGVINGHLIKSLGRGDRVDASLIAAFVPFATFDPAGDLADRTYSKIVDDLAPDGVHRYLGDTYFGGGRWVVLAGFVGAFEAATGRETAARRRLDWIREQQTGTGLLPEQTTDHVLDATYIDEWVQRWGPVATPLLWSHAMYLTLTDELDK